MATVRRRDNEDLESMLRRFRRKVNDDMIFADLKKKEFHMTKAQKRRKKEHDAAAKRRKFSRTFRPRYED